MSKSAIKEFRNSSLEEIETKIIEVKQEIFSLKLKKATKQLDKSHLFKHNKHILAQLLTVEAELKKK
uniref:Large ribosomal subunit protein uL29c n=1 Tax=Erythrotrichia carnea TaxID=35151 RepID=A0A1C9CEN7_9RHOD|nr:ribosomal protein L29 [Erythrotrichia carnea]AOM66851.1 ribosomal protein L29 [Erythrotrichia carnea]